MPQFSLSRQAARDVDRRAESDYGVPSIVLMENAGRGVAELLLRLGFAGPVVVCAGKGNNGGDGFVIARHLENRGHDVQVLFFGNPDELKGDAAVNFRILRAAGTPLLVFDNQIDTSQIDRQLGRAEWIVDALLGTGAQGPPRGSIEIAIERINAAQAKVLSVDVPSGLDCDTGQPFGPTVLADHTATFVARKIGFDAPGVDSFTGEIHVIDIGVPRKMLLQDEGKRAR